MENEILDDQIFESKEGQTKIEYAGFWIRTGAAMLDGLVMLPFLWISNINNTELKSVILLVILQTLMMLYKPLMEGKRSATLGKMALKLRVVDQDMNPITMQTSFVRNSPWLVSYVIGLILSIQMFMSPAFLEVEGFMEAGLLMQNSSLYILNTIYSFVFLFIILAVAFDSQKQGLHDKFARTFCIKE